MVLRIATRFSIGGWVASKDEAEPWDRARIASGFSMNMGAVAPLAEATEARPEIFSNAEANPSG